MKIFKKISALLLVLALGIVLTVPVSANEAELTEVEQEIVTILQDSGLLPDRFVNTVEEAFLECDLGTTPEQAATIRGLIDDAVGIANDSGSIAEIAQLVEQAADLLNLEIVITLNGEPDADFTCPPENGGGGNGNGGNGGNGNGGNGGNGRNNIIRQTGLNASASLVGMLGLTGVAGGAGLIAKLKD